jgi:hypothetical protein
MSLASYRAAPPRVKDYVWGVSVVLIGMRIALLCRPGGDLLFRVLRRSTIGAGEFNGRVRDGIGFGLPAIATRPAKQSDVCVVLE